MDFDLAKPMVHNSPNNNIADNGKLPIKVAEYMTNFASQGPPHKLNNANLAPSSTLGTEEAPPPGDYTSFSINRYQELMKHESQMKTRDLPSTTSLSYSISQMQQQSQRNQKMFERLPI